MNKTKNDSYFITSLILDYNVIMKQEVSGKVQMYPKEKTFISLLHFHGHVLNS